jgi:DNA-directed RNA polymerase sigma subunit (sigma70/sigma32)
VKRNTDTVLALWRGEVTLEDIEKMPVRSAIVLLTRSNLLGQVLTFAQLSRWFGVCNARIQQIEQTALNKACRRNHNRVTRTSEERHNRCLQRWYPNEHPEEVESWSF